MKFQNSKYNILNEGRAITNGKFAYGGFPRILNEEGGAVEAFRDDTPDDQATKPNEATPTLAELRAIEDAAFKAHIEHGKKMGDWNHPDVKALHEKWRLASVARLMHPDTDPREREGAFGVDRHKIDIDDVVAASFGRRRAPEIDSDEVAGRNRGPKRMPPTVYDQGIGPDDARRRR